MLVQYSAPCYRVIIYLKDSHVDGPNRGRRVQLFALYNHESALKVSELESLLNTNKSQFSQETV